MPLSTAQARQRWAFLVAEEGPSHWGPRPTVYLDTTIPSYLTAPMSADITTARRQRMTRTWWSRHRRNFTICVSDLLLREAEAGRADASRARLRALANIDSVHLSHRCDALLSRLVVDGLFPPKATTDAGHIAIAAANSVRFLLTWNYKHLANSAIVRRVSQICESFDFRCPEICTPEELMRIYAHERLSR